jgi:TetR/AcrR family transcriptional regulator, transcriptional repressor for nem operon
VSPRTGKSREAVTPHGRRTREALLAAGQELAEERGLAGISVNAVVERAGVAKGTFYVHFAERSGFIDALHQAFYDRVSTAVAAAVGDLPPGRERLLAGIHAYLDTCLRERAIKALILETRTEGSLTTTIAEREALFARLAEPSIRAIGWPDAKPTARLLVAMTFEVALIELEQGRRSAPARRALGRFMDQPPREAPQD